MVTITTNHIYPSAPSNSQDSSPGRLESFISWEDDAVVVNQQSDLRKKYPAASQVVMIQLEKSCPTIGEQ